MQKGRSGYLAALQPVARCNRILYIGAMSPHPNHAHAVRTGFAQLCKPNPNRDGTGITAEVLQAGITPSKIERVIINAIGGTSFGMIRLFLQSPAGAMHLVCEVPVGDIAPLSAKLDFSTPDELVAIPPGWSLRASTEKPETFNVFAIAGSL